MEFRKTTDRQAYALKITAHDGDKQIGRLYLYILKNDLHAQPFAFLEDVFVDEAYRKQGIGSKLVEQAVAEARALGCYKLVGNSRTGNDKVHAFYERLGFKKHGFEFRIDFSDL